jgi:hypothetical protein
MCRTKTSILLAIINPHINSMHEVEVDMSRGFSIILRIGMGESGFLKGPTRKTKG